MTILALSIKGLIVALITGLDKLAFPQIMICRPIVAAPLTGFFLGDVQIGLTIGLVLELLWLSVLPMGATVPPDDTLHAVTSTVITIWLAGIFNTPPHELFALPVLVCMPLSRIGRLFEMKVRKINDSLLPDTKSINPGKISQMHFLGILHFSIAISIAYILAILIGAAGSFMIAKLILPTLITSNSWLQYIFPFIGAALYISKVHVTRAMTLFIASFSMVTLIVWLI